MTEEEHRQRHEVLHRMLDELVADWISHSTRLPGQATVMELMTWASKQAKAPDHPGQEQGEPS